MPHPSSTRSIPRRRIFGVVALLAGGAFAQGPSPADALEVLREGNARFAAGESRVAVDHARMRVEPSADPIAVIVTSSDSRVSPEYVFDTAPGQLIVVRAAGPVCTPEVVAALEHAVGERAVPLCIVLGMDRSQWLDDVGLDVGSPAMEQVRARVLPAMDRARGTGLDGDALLREAERTNARRVVSDAVRRSELLRAALLRGSVELRTACYSQRTGEVEWFAPLAAGGARTSGDDPAALPPHVAFELLRAGHRRFLSGSSRVDRSVARRRSLADGTRPLALVVTCSDTPVAPEQVFDCGLGELEVVRVPGTAVGFDAIASVERAVLAAGTPLIVVLGHERCGALETALDGDAGMMALTESLAAVARQARVDAGGDAGAAIERAVELGVRQAEAELRGGSEVVRAAERRGALDIVAGVADVHGRVRWLGVGAVGTGVSLVSPPRPDAERGAEAAAIDHEPVGSTRPSRNVSAANSMRPVAEAYPELMRSVAESEADDGAERAPDAVAVEGEALAGAGPGTPPVGLEPDQEPAIPAVVATGPSATSPPAETESGMPDRRRAADRARRGEPADRREPVGWLNAFGLFTVVLMSGLALVVLWQHRRSEAEPVAS